MRSSAVYDKINSKEADNPRLFVKMYKHIVFRINGCFSVIAPNHERKSKNEDENQGDIHIFSIDHDVLRYDVGVLGKLIR